MKSNNVKKHVTQAMSFVILLGIISMFSDMTHEAASGIKGAYLSLLGASAATVGFVSGFGELVGYSLRLVFGKLTDKTKKYWTITIIGYCIDVFAVPALALVGENGWIWACALIIAERAGKALKKPAKNTILSFAASLEGVGRSFALQEALDQIGAFLGPLFLYLIMLFKNGSESQFDVYRKCFAFLLIPAVITVALLFFAKRKYPHPEKFEPETDNNEKFKLKPSFAVYIAAICVFVFGFIDFPLITLHLNNSGLFATEQLPLIYAGAMLFDAVSALFFGRLYDKKGIIALTVSTLCAASFSLFVFGFNSVWAMLAGSALWGIGMGAQESVFKAAVSTMVPKNQRAAGYGLFECMFGIFWFLGSWLLGVLYDASIIAMICVSFGAQVIAAIAFVVSARLNRDEKKQVGQCNN